MLRRRQTFVGSHRTHRAEGSVPQRQVNTIAREASALVLKWLACCSPCLAPSWNMCPRGERLQTGRFPHACAMPLGMLGCYQTEPPRVMLRRGTPQGGSKGFQSLEAHALLGWAQRRLNWLRAVERDPSGDAPSPNYRRQGFTEVTRCRQPRGLRTSRRRDVLQLAPQRLSEGSRRPASSSSPVKWRRRMPAASACSNSCRSTPRAEDRRAECGIATQRTYTVRGGLGRRRSSVVTTATDPPPFGNDAPPHCVSTIRLGSWIVELW